MSFKLRGNYIARGDEGVCMFALSLSHSLYSLNIHEEAILSDKASRICPFNASGVHHHSEKDRKERRENKIVLKKRGFVSNERAIERRG